MGMSSAKRPRTGRKCDPLDWLDRLLSSEYAAHKVEGRTLCSDRSQKRVFEAVFKSCKRYTCLQSAPQKFSTPTSTPPRRSPTSSHQQVKIGAAGHTRYIPP